MMAVTRPRRSRRAASSAYRCRRRGPPRARHDVAARSARPRRCRDSRLVRPSRDLDVRGRDESVAGDRGGNPYAISSSVNPRSVASEPARPGNFAYYSMFPRGLSHQMEFRGDDHQGQRSLLAYARLAYFEDIDVPSAVELLVVVAGALTAAPAIIAVASRFGLLDPKRPSRSKAGGGSVAPPSAGPARYSGLVHRWPWSASRSCPA